MSAFLPSASEAGGIGAFREACATKCAAAAVALLALGFVLARPALATTIASDAFDYPDGSNLMLDGGFGWAAGSSWTWGGVADGHVNVTGTSDRRRALADEVELDVGESIYFGFRIVQSDGRTGMFGLQTSGRTQDQFQVGIEIGAFKMSGGVAFGPAPHGVTYDFVGRVTQLADNQGLFTAWVNPTSESSTMLGTRNVRLQGPIHSWVSNGPSTGFVRLDDVWVGTSFADAPFLAPSTGGTVPEPGAAGLLACGITAIAAARRRRR